METVSRLGLFQFQIAFLRSCLKSPERARNSLSTSTATSQSRFHRGEGGNEGLSRSALYSQSTTNTHTTQSSLIPNSFDRPLLFLAFIQNNGPDPSSSSTQNDRPLLTDRLM
ncbi:hypothetical protein L596_024140 [Steinernema carpocapsae]|uniref:Uncharacterized protein n=1 Tax=Steinernema carpocapsae TaxID=34508 RepID=A0A4U5MFU5_STECR|nr:hypothetical protein L596_024140 [Steinernema carpocapsae]